jgi:dienelactone hydrolase
MKTIYYALAATSCFALSAQAQTTSQTPTETATPTRAPSASLVPPPDAPPPKNNPPGPYLVTIESDPSLPTHTIYRPTDLSSFKGKKALPIISWGNGACANAGTLFQVFLTQIASHGYIAISIGPKDAPLPAFATGARPSAATAPGAAPAAAPALVAFSKDEQIIDAIDWAVKENNRKGSAYYQHLDTNKIAVMGQSCGGLQTIAASSDPRVKTSVVWNSGTFPEDGKSPGANLSGARKASLAKFHAPVAYFNGGPADIAYTNSEDDFKRITVPVFKGSMNVGHGGTYRHPGGGWFGEVGVAWLDWQLKGDKQAAKYFDGKDCMLCTNPLWTIEKKNMR